MEYTNHARLPKGLFRALTEDNHKTTEGAFGVTELIDSPRIRRLKEQYEDRLTADATDNVQAVIGTAVHTMLEKLDAGITDTMFCAEVEGAQVCGTPDHVEDGSLYDYKVSKTWVHTFGVRQSWIEQLNIYRWLLRENDIIVNDLYSVVIYKDWSATSHRENYPPYAAEVFDVPTWTLKETEEFLVCRIQAHQQEELPLCSPEERWQKDGDWAVHLNGRWRAERLLSSLQEARQWIALNDGDPDAAPVYDKVEPGNGFSIIKRPDEWKRCANYCPVAEYCEQWQEFQHAQATLDSHGF